MIKRRLIRMADENQANQQVNNGQKQILTTVADDIQTVVKDMTKLKSEVNQAKGVIQNSEGGEKLLQDFDIIDVAQSALSNLVWDLDNFNPQQMYDIDQINLNNQDYDSGYNLAEEQPLEEQEDIENPESEEGEAEGEGAEGGDGSEGGDMDMGDADGDDGGGDMDFNFE